MPRPRNISLRQLSFETLFCRAYLIEIPWGGRARGPTAIWGYSEAISNGRQFRMEGRRARSPAAPPRAADLARFLLPQHKLHLHILSRRSQGFKFGGLEKAPLLEPFRHRCVWP